MAATKITLGMVVRDRISGMEGVVSGVALYLFGCVSILVRPQAMKDSLPVKGVWLDEGQLEILKDRLFDEEEPAKPRKRAPKKRKPAKKARATGGPRDDLPPDGATQAPPS